MQATPTHSMVTVSWTTSTSFSWWPCWKGYCCTNEGERSSPPPLVDSGVSAWERSREREIVCNTCTWESYFLFHLSLSFFTSYLHHSLSTSPFAQSALLTALQATPTSHTYRITWLSRVYIDCTETVQGAGLRQQQQCWTTAVWCEWISLKIENSSAFHIFSIVNNTAAVMQRNAAVPQ